MTGLEILDISNLVLYKFYIVLFLTYYDVFVYSYGLSRWVKSIFGTTWYNICQDGNKKKGDSQDSQRLAANQSSTQVTKSISKYLKIPRYPMIWYLYYPLSQGVDLTEELWLRATNEFNLWHKKASKPEDLQLYHDLHSQVDSSYLIPFRWVLLLVAGPVPQFRWQAAEMEPE